MFNSLANLLFGSNANTSTNPESTDQIEQILEDNNTNSSLQATASTTTATSIGRNTDNNNQNVSNRSVEDHLKKLISIDHNNDDDVTNVDELDDDWLLVNREDDEEDSLPRTDSEEELPFVEIKRSPTFQQRPTRNSNHHSLSAYHQRTIALRYDGGGLTQSLYVVPSSADCNNGTVITTNLPTHMSMEESWFLTPPPCFTSTGPVNMETSPFENLLIEHPSMSVYHSIRSAQEAAESFINLDLGVEESQNGTMVVVEQPTGRNQSVAPRVARNRVERLNPTQCKMEYLTRSAQKVHDKKDRQTICRGAIKRSNKVREYNSKSNRQRRSDLQHSKISSGANNNRKC
ncbi:tumor protein p53-inducible nuclear protein 1 [Eupeodes corollae]|uniref:tumor protein p53-inducible nuclear protein 1 n=1 Tax=Eupeodes corollae TaxID=290404 RepID=UPI0024935EC4|nr:tumor protein p53-inducible nuclear protein 1 [Eupeodes corollae]XP_055913565.1 tumor protein p53-inducible nuclear protein 1 [Eupeodes corollae]XP_055913566.1 tumor protein p53-inducible nuclear protein 1 [Eupeodes corollae]